MASVESADVPRRYGRVDHIYITCLECRFIGSWQPSASMHYRADLNQKGAIVKLVDINERSKEILFKTGAYVTLLPTNVLTYETEDVEKET